MVYCAVPICKSDSKKTGQNGVSFHEFPVDEHLRLKWLLAIRRKDQHSSKPWVPGDRTVICSNHFLPSDFRSSLKIRRLIPNAVPSVFVGYPPSYQIHPKKARKTFKRNAVTQLRTSKGKGTVPSIEHGTLMTKVPNEQEILVNMKVPGGQEALMNMKVSEAVDEANVKVTDEREIILRTEPPAELTGSVFKDARVGTKLTIAHLNENQRKIKTLQSHVQRLNSKVSQYQSELKELKRENNQLRQEIAFFTK